MSAMKTISNKTRRAPGWNRLDKIEDFSIYRPATFVQRWYALALDLAFFMPLALLVRQPWQRALERLHAYGHLEKYLFYSLILLVIPLLVYFVAPTLFTGQTLGKRIVGLRVIRRDCAPGLSFGQLLIRETLGRLLSLVVLGLGYLLVIVDQRHRALHDHLAGTVVICYRQR